MTRAEFCAFVREHDNFVILTHRRPDGDTIGCGSALYYALKALEKTKYFRELQKKIDFFRRNGKIIRLAYYGNAWAILAPIGE